MSKTDVLVGQCDEVDFPELLPLFAQAYQFNPRLQERDYCDWQFKNTPFSKEEGYSILVAKEQGGISGFLGYFPVEFRLSGDIHTGCISYNWYATRQSRSGIKLLSELMVRYGNIFYLGCTTESEAIFKLFRMPMSFLSRWVGVINGEKVRDIFHIQDKMILSQVTASHNRINALEDSTSSIYPCKRFNDDDEFFFDQWGSIKGYIRRTGKYLNWRYIDIPRHNYQVIRDNNGQFAVYRVEQIKDHQEKVIRILEWNFYGRSAEGAISFIVKEGLRQGAILIDFISSAAEIGMHMESLGFFPATDHPGGIPYLFRPIYYTRDVLIAVDLPPHRVEREFDFTQWYITKGDSDMDRIKL